MVSLSPAFALTSATSYTEVDNKRDAPTTVTVTPSAFPTYASACSSFAKYSSACSCLGVTGTITTLPQPTVTVDPQNFVIQIHGDGSANSGSYMYPVVDLTYGGGRFYEFDFTDSISLAGTFKLVGDSLYCVTNIDTLVLAVPGSGSDVFARVDGGQDTEWEPVVCSIDGDLLQCNEVGYPDYNVSFDHFSLWSMSSEPEAAYDPVITLKIVSPP